MAKLLDEYCEKREVRGENFFHQRLPAFGGEIITIIKIRVPFFLIVTISIRIYQSLFGLNEYFWMTG